MSKLIKNDLANGVIPMNLAQPEGASSCNNELVMTSDDRVGDLAMLVRRLVRSLRSANYNPILQAQALDYLEQHGLTGDVLRKES